jgi:hypothetical protein
MKDLYTVPVTELGYVVGLSNYTGFPCRFDDCTIRPLPTSKERTEHEINVHEFHYVVPPWTTRGYFTIGS